MRLSDTEGGTEDFYTPRSTDTDVSKGNVGGRIKLFNQLLGGRTESQKVKVNELLSLHLIFMHSLLIDRMLLFTSAGERERIENATVTMKRA